MDISQGLFLLVYDHLFFICKESDSFTTWIIAALGTDHGYYWAHRMMHECNIIWAAHQVSHILYQFKSYAGGWSL